MGTKFDRVVVKVTPRVQSHNEKKLFVARFVELGLTAYGSTPDEAVGALKITFHHFITHLRKTNRLEEALNKSGLTWSWESEYADPKMPAEDAMPKKPAKGPIPQAAAWDVVSRQPVAMAA